MFKTSESYAQSVKYKRARNKVISQLRKAKAEFFRGLNPRDPMKFWMAVKYLNKHQSSIPSLSQGGTSCHSIKR